MSSYDWSIHKKLINCGGMGPVVYIHKARGNNKPFESYIQLVSMMRAGKRVVYVYPVDTVKTTSIPSNLPDMDILTPDDCKRGEWCKACEFVNVYHVPSLYTLGYEITATSIYTCGKGESCKNFVQKSKGEN